MDLVSPFFLLEKKAVKSIKPLCNYEIKYMQSPNFEICKFIREEVSMEERGILQTIDCIKGDFYS